MGNEESKPHQPDQHHIEIDNPGMCSSLSLSCKQMCNTPQNRLPPQGDSISKRSSQQPKGSASEIRDQVVSNFQELNCKKPGPQLVQLKKIQIKAEEGEQEQQPQSQINDSRHPHRPPQKPVYLGNSPSDFIQGPFGPRPFLGQRPTEMPQGMATPMTSIPTNGRKQSSIWNMGNARGFPSNTPSEVDGYSKPPVLPGLSNPGSITQSEQKPREGELTNAGSQAIPPPGFESSTNKAAEPEEQKQSQQEEPAKDPLPQHHQLSFSHQPAEDPSANSNGLLVQQLQSSTQAQNEQSPPQKIPETSPDEAPSQEAPQKKEEKPVLISGDSQPEDNAMRVHQPYIDLLNQDPQKKPGSQTDVFNQTFAKDATKADEQTLETKPEVEKKKKSEEEKTAPDHPVIFHTSKPSDDKIRAQNSAKFGGDTSNSEKPPSCFHAGINPIQEDDQDIIDNQPVFMIRDRGVASSPQAPVSGPMLDIDPMGKKIGPAQQPEEKTVSMKEVGSGTENDYTWATISTPSQSPDIGQMKGLADNQEDRNSKGSPTASGLPPISVSAEQREKTKRADSQKTKPQASNSSNTEEKQEGHRSQVVMPSEPMQSNADQVKPASPATREMPEVQYVNSQEDSETVPSFKGTNQRSNSQCNPGSSNLEKGPQIQGQGQPINQSEEEKLEIKPKKQESRKMSVGQLMSNNIDDIDKQAMKLSIGRINTIRNKKKKPSLHRGNTHSDVGQLRPSLHEESKSASQEEQSLPSDPSQQHKMSPPTVIKEVIPEVEETKEAGQQSGTRDITKEGMQLSSKPKEEEGEEQLQMGTILNPIGQNLKEKVIVGGFLRIGSGQLAQKSKKNVVRWQTISDSHNGFSTEKPLQTIPEDYEPVSLLQSSQFGDTYLIRMKPQSSGSQSEGQPPENIQSELYILKLIDKSRFLKKERAANLKQIQSMMHVDHPTVSSYSKFFMSKDFFYFISKSKLMLEECKLLTSLQSIPNLAEVEPEKRKLKPIGSTKDLDFKSYSSLMIKDPQNLQKFGTQKDLIDAFDTKILSSLNLASKITELNNIQNNKFLQNHLIGASQIKKILPKSLARVLTDFKQTLSTRQIANVAKEILMALQFIHSKDVVHLNLNPQNILIPRHNVEGFFNGVLFEDEHPERGNLEEEVEGGSQAAKERTNVLLINFCQASQFSKKIKFNNQEHTPVLGGREEMNPDGTIKEKNTSKYQSPQQQNVKFSEICFMAPERITGNLKYEDIEMSKRTDIWSIGVIIYVLFAGQLPFKGDTCQQLYESIKRSEFMFPGPEWEHIPQSAKNLIQMMLKKDPCDRVDAVTALDHAFFEEAQEDHERQFNQYPPMNTILAEQSRVWFCRDPIIGKNTEILLSKLNLIDQMFLYHSFLHSNAHLIQVFTNVFKTELEQTPYKKPEQVEADPKQTPEKRETSSSDLMYRADCLELTFEKAENGLSFIMGDKTLAKWFLKQIEFTMKRRNSRNNVTLEAPQTITLKELIEFYLELFLGKIDYQLQQAFLEVLQLGTPAKAMQHIRDCLRMALTVNTDHLGSEGIDLTYTYLRQLILETGSPPSGE